MDWAAIVPFNYGQPCKTRLAPLLAEDERAALALAMARRVVDVLTGMPGIVEVNVVAPLDPALAPALWRTDGGRGLNVELAAAREVVRRPTLFLHADLPLLHRTDVRALLDAAEAAGSAIAPDMAGHGTNAIALADDRAFAPAFGVDSFVAHRALLPDAAIIRREGLSCDVDDAQSLHLATARGFAWQVPIIGPSV